MLRRHDLNETALRVNTMTDSSLIALELTAVGFGPCIVQNSYTTHYLRERGLYLPFADGIDIPESHFILTAHAVERTTPEAAIFRDWLIEAMRDARDAARLPTE